MLQFRFVTTFIACMPLFLPYSSVLNIDQWKLEKRSICALTWWSILPYTPVALCDKPRLQTTHGEVELSVFQVLFLCLALNYCASCVSTMLSNIMHAQKNKNPFLCVCEWVCVCLVFRFLAYSLSMSQAWNKQKILLDKILLSRIKEDTSYKFVNVTW